MLIANPNHIGCHTLDGEKEALFKGSQEIEKDLIRICAEEILAQNLINTMVTLRPAEQKPILKPAGFTVITL